MNQPSIAPILQMQGVAKRFTLHHQNGIELPVLAHVDLAVQPGECVVLDGPSGMGKSTLLKMIYANYRVNAGRITVRSADGAVVDVTQATPRALVQLRRDTVGYVSQFLRVIPRVSALDVVAEPLAEDARDDPAGIESAREAAPAARYLLGRGAAAHQHCPQHDQAQAFAAAGRAHRIARCSQYRDRDHHDP